MIEYQTVHDSYRMPSIEHHILEKERGGWKHYYKHPMDGEVRWYPEELDDIALNVLRIHYPLSEKI